MGREIRRVPLDFDWPLNEVWAGFINPFYKATKCPDCDGKGYAPDAKRLSDQWYGYVSFSPSETGSKPFSADDPTILAFAKRNGSSDLTGVQRIMFYGKNYSNDELILAEARRLSSMWNAQWSRHLDQDDVNALWGEGRLSDFNPNWDENHNEGVPAPTTEDVNRWSIASMGHDSINQWICVREKCKRLGYALNCPRCNGEAEIWPSKAMRDLYEAWKDIDPPSGEGWQVWETVSEGSPVSPVFGTAELLVDYLVENGQSRKAAEAFVKDDGWVPSMVMTRGPEGTALYEDIESATLTKD